MKSKDLTQVLFSTKMLGGLLKVFKTEELGSTKFLWWEQIWLCSRNRKKASVAGVQKWNQCVDWDEVKGGAELII